MTAIYKLRIKRSLCAGVFMLPLLLAVTAPVTAQAADKRSIWQTLFPFHTEQDETIPPEQSLQAPFADPEAVVPQAAPDGLADLYDDGSAAAAARLESMHRAPDQISHWLTASVSNILTFDAPTFSTHREQLKVGMSEAAITDFADFIEKSRLLQSLQTNKLVLTSFVESPPLLLNQGVIAGRYRWLYEVQVALSFMPEGAVYQNTTPTTQYVIVTLQVGRVPPGQGVDELMIESFKVKKNPNKS